MSTRDLSHPLDSDVTVYPGDPPVERTPVATHADDGYRVTDLRLGSHSGTHIDAPSHTEPDGRDLASFEIDRFVFDARLVDCLDAGARDPLGPSDLSCGDEASADALVVRTGWDAHWGTDRYYDHPYLTQEAAEWCAERGYHVGLDVLSPDPSPSASGLERSAEPDGVPAHHELLGADRFVVENLTDLGDLPSTFELRAYPLPLADADGAPVRAVAAW